MGVIFAKKCFTEAAMLDWEVNRTFPQREVSKQGCDRSGGHRGGTANGIHTWSLRARSGFMCVDPRNISVMLENEARDVSRGKQ